MLDNSVTLFNVSLDNNSKPETDERLIWDSCKAILSDSTYSEFDEMSFANVKYIRRKIDICTIPLYDYYAKTA